jgi:hypothetical protein
MKPTRRRLLVRAGVCLTLGFAFPASIAWAAPPLVEVIAFAHPPVQAALKPLREWLSSQGNRVRMVEIDMESPTAAKRLQALGISGHVPIVVLVNGQYKHTREDGSAVELVGFPSGPSAPAEAKGGWWTGDAQAMVEGFMH